MAKIVRIVCAANGSPTPHDGRFVVDWNPHTQAGILELTSTPDPKQARRFERTEAFMEWNTVSNLEPRRPWDQQPNKPLTGITIIIEDEPHV